MKKPYIVCHMMTSLDSRIDCAMTAQLPGVDDYYRTLDALNVPTTVSGRVTAQLEMALPGEYQASDPTPVDKEAFSKKADAPGYEVVADTHGKLLWPDAGEPEKPLLILTSEQVPQEYLTYLDSRNISWIAMMVLRRSRSWSSYCQAPITRFTVPHSPQLSYASRIFTGI